MLSRVSCMDCTHCIIDDSDKPFRMSPTEYSQDGEALSALHCKKEKVAPHKKKFCFKYDHKQNN